MHVCEHQILPKEKEAEAQTFQMLGLEGSRKTRSWRVADLAEPIQMSHEKTRGPLLSIQSWLINRVLILDYNNPYIILSSLKALCNLNNKVFFIAQMEIR